MTDGKASNVTEDSLLARLNALKQTNISLNQKPYIEDFSRQLPNVSPAPARDLFDTLSDRFKTLRVHRDERLDVIDSIDNGQRSDLVGDEDGKTVEDLLAELGPEDQWLLPKDEEAQIADLLTSANTALQETDSLRRVGDREDDNTQKNFPPQISHGLETVDAHPDGKQDDADLDSEADAILAETVDQIEEERRFMRIPSGQVSRPGHSNSTNESATDPNSDGGLQPSHDDPPAYNDVQDEDDLSARFAALNMPATPSIIKAPARPPTQVVARGQDSKLIGGHTDEDIESWCVICQEDATLSCVGCDDDLYCTNCWLEGHRGPDAGYEERKHKAVQYNRRKKKQQQKQSANRTLVGA